MGSVLRSHDNLLPNDVIVAVLSIVSGSGLGEVYIRSYDGGVRRVRREDERKTATAV